MNAVKRISLLLVLLTSFFIGPALAGGTPTEETVIVAMGDSLMAGYNLPPNKGFPNQLEAWLQGRGHNVRVINAGVSGDTSTAGLSRLDWTLAGAPNGKPDLFIVEFGGNDMLRGIDPAVTRKSMEGILQTATERGIPVLLAGMMAAPNLGRGYQEDFNPIFPELAEKFGVHFYPFFLEGVAGIQSLNLDDGIHPNVEGVAVMVENMGPLIEDLIDD